MIIAVAIKDVDGTIHQMDSPKRHGDILNQLARNKIKSEPDGHGFIDNELGFVGRRTAWYIAMDQNQLLEVEHTQIRGTLFSEDIW